MYCFWPPKDGPKPLLSTKASSSVSLSLIHIMTNRHACRIFFSAERWSLFSHWFAFSAEKGSGGRCFNALHVAVMKGHDGVLEKLLDADASPTIPYKDVRCPFTTSVYACFR